MPVTPDCIIMPPPTFKGLWPAAAAKPPEVLFPKKPPAPIVAEPAAKKSFYNGKLLLNVGSYYWCY